MLADGASKFITEVREALARAESPEHVLSLVTTLLADHLRCDRVHIHIEDGNQKFENSWGEAASSPEVTPLFRCEKNGLRCGDQLFNDQLFINDVDRSRVAPELLEALEAQDTRSFALIPLRSSSSCIGWIEIHFRSSFHRWRKEDVFLLDIFSEYGILYLERHLMKGRPPEELPQGTKEPRNKQDDLYRERLLEARQQYRRLLEYGNLIIVRTNADGMVTDVIGDTETIFGVSPGELVSDLGVWGRFVPARDLRSLIRSLRNVKAEKKIEVSEEIRVINHKTKETRWLLIRGIPFFSAQGEFVGWEGFAVDITERHAIQDELIRQRKRLEALYEISRSLHVTMEPSVVLLKGLRALMKATGAEGGFSAVFDNVDGVLDLAAIEGFSQKEVEDIQKGIRNTPLFTNVIHTKTGKIVSEADCKQRISSLAVMHSMMLIPLAYEGEVRGIVAIVSRREDMFDTSDYDLASIGAGQICATLNQAEFYLSERRQSDALAFLYKVSHVLGQFQTPKEIAEHAFPIIQEEIPCKRMWLGIMNEQGTHVIGQAGVGPGMRSSIINVQIELDLRHDFLDEAIRKRQPIILRAGEKAECSGLNRIMQRLEPDAIVITPLVALGQVVGILVLEPSVSSQSFIQRKLPLLNSVSNELGSVILARRFESRIADAEKMRMASLFASGVAHNFNNLLQAVMGQASLIEIQLPAHSPLAKSAQLITEAATKGASLISQLMSFSSSAALDRKPLGVHQLLSDSKELYQSIVGQNITLTLELEDGRGTVYADAGQLQRVMTNLLLNAKEALHGREDGAVRITTRTVRLRSGEIDPELAPGSYLRIDIVDNGPGMDAEKLGRCFEPFFTTKGLDNATGLGLTGSGLGLSSSYSIIKQHDGLLTALSQPGSGAMLSMYLPQSKVDQLESGRERTLQSSDVLLYGLEPLIAGSLASSLKAFDLSVLGEDDRKAVLASVGNQNMAPALLVIDAEKEDAKISEFIKTVRNTNTKLKLIIYCVDGRRSSGLISAMGRIDDLEVVEKSLGLWALQSTIKRMLGIKSNRQSANAIEIETIPDEETPPTPSNQLQASKGIMGK